VVSNGVNFVHKKAQRRRDGRNELSLRLIVRIVVRR